MNHVGALVGGFDSRQLHGGQDGVRFTAVPPDVQRAAVEFLNQNAFETPDFLVRPEILRRIEPSGVLSRLRNSQRSVLNFLLNAGRFTRLVEQNALDGTAYDPIDFLGDLRNGIWAELSESSVTTDAFRRNLQRLYIDLIDTRLNADDVGWNDMRAFLRGQLKTLDSEVASSITRTDDDATRFHLEDVRDEIAAILNPEIYRPETNSTQLDGFNEAPDPFDPYTVYGCWVDFLIQP